MPSACPTCGYDLRAIRERWVESCTLEVTCSECGGTHASALVFAPKPPAWSFEHARRAGAGAFIGTTVRCFMPGALWKGLADLPVRPARLVLFAAAWLVMLHLTVFGVVASGGWAMTSLVSPFYGRSFVQYFEDWNPSMSGTTPGLLPALLWPYSRWFEFPIDATSARADAIWSFVIAASLPTLITGLCVRVLVPRMSAGIFWRRLPRGLVYTLPSSAAWLAAMASMIAISTIEARVPRLEWIPRTITLLLLAGYLGWLTAWWRAFLAHQAGVVRIRTLVFLVALASAGGLLVAASAISSLVR